MGVIPCWQAWTSTLIGLTGWDICQPRVSMAIMTVPGWMNPPLSLPAPGAAHCALPPNPLGKPPTCRCISSAWPVFMGQAAGQFPKSAMEPRAGLSKLGRCSAVFTPMTSPRSSPPQSHSRAPERSIIYAMMIQRRRKMCWPMPLSFWACLCHRRWTLTAQK